MTFFPKGKRNFLANVLFADYSPARFLLEQRSRRCLTVLTYHRISPAPGPDYPFVKSVIEADRNSFDDHLRFLRKRFTIIDFRQFSEIQREYAGRRMPRDLLIISFDDGYLDNRTNMLPVLQDNNVTAVVFVTSGTVEAQDLFWVDSLSHALIKMENKMLSLLDGRYEIDVQSDNRRSIHLRIANICHGLNRRDLQSLVVEVREQSGVRPSADEMELAQPMSWADVRYLHECGIEIGSHTISHGFLDSMLDAELEDEIHRSKQMIEARIGEEVISIAYPAGKYDQRVVNATKSAGYQFGCSYRHATSVITSQNRFEIPRLHVRPWAPMAQFRATICMPEVF